MKFFRHAKYAPLAAILFVGTSVGFASVRIDYPEFRQKFANQRACIAALEKAWKDDLQKVGSQKNVGHGPRREVSLATRGVVVIDRRTAIYEASVWTAHRWIRPDLGQSEIAHHFNEQTRICKKGLMRTTSSQGNTLNSFEPIPSDKD